MKEDNDDDKEDIPDVDKVWDSKKDGLLDIILVKARSLSLSTRTKTRSETTL